MSHGEGPRALAPAAHAVSPAAVSPGFGRGDTPAPGAESAGACGERVGRRGCAAHGLSQIRQSNCNPGEELYDMGMGMAGEPGAGCAIRAAATVEDAGVYHHGDPDPGAGDWGECG